MQDFSTQWEHFWTIDWKFERPEKSSVFNGFSLKVSSQKCIKNQPNEAQISAEFSGDVLGRMHDELTWCIWSWINSVDISVPPMKLRMSMFEIRAYFFQGPLGRSIEINE